MLARKLAQAEKDPLSAERMLSALHRVQRELVERAAHPADAATMQLGTLMVEALYSLDGRERISFVRSRIFGDVTADLVTTVLGCRAACLRHGQALEAQAQRLLELSAITLLEELRAELDDWTAATCALLGSRVAQPEPRLPDARFIVDHAAKLQDVFRSLEKLREGATAHATGMEAAALRLPRPRLLC